MYKFVLCWRYLLTRYLAFACIFSVMLGVATLIVVNSVMGGFSTKLKDRLHGLLSDVLIEATSFDGFADPDELMQRIRQSPAGAKIEAMTSTLDVFAMIEFNVFIDGREERWTRPVHLVGIDPKGRAAVGGFSKYLVEQKDRPNPDFSLNEEGKRRFRDNNLFRPIPFQTVSRRTEPGEPPPPDPPPSEIKEPQGIILGNCLASYRDPHAHAGTPTEDIYILKPGDSVMVYTVSGQVLKAVYDRFVVCDYFKSEMSEYDTNYVFVSLEYLQRLRAMENRVSNIQIRLKDYHDAADVVKVLETLLPANGRYLVQTWEHKQGPLLAAIAVEKGLLNVLLFLIIGVAGFGILAIFSMIVTEKTRDIGILKALGASNSGVMKIFLGYGLLLGIVGAGLGTALGLVLTDNINEIEQWLGRLTGQDLFPRNIYYFDKIPTDVQALSVALVNVGALAIAVLASVLPALRAALLHPVKALRYE